MSRQERTGWRDDLRLNDLHRTWGINCPATDLDCVFVEFDSLMPIAIVEYKHEAARQVTRKTDQIQVLINLANGYLDGLPALLVRYSDDLSTWRVTPLNKAALRFCEDKNTQALPTQDYVRFLYRLRGREMPADLFVAGAMKDPSPADDTDDAYWAKVDEWLKPKPHETELKAKLDAELARCKPIEVPF